jgi:hypothetical protein
MCLDKESILQRRRSEMGLRPHPVVGIYIGIFKTVARAKAGAHNTPQKTKRT